MTGGFNERQTERENSDQYIPGTLLIIGTSIALIWLSMDVIRLSGRGAGAEFAVLAVLPYAALGFFILVGSLLVTSSQPSVPRGVRILRLISSLSGISAVIFAFLL